MTKNERDNLLKEFGWSDNEKINPTIEGWNRLGQECGHGMPGERKTSIKGDEIFDPTISECDFTYDDEPGGDTDIDCDVPGKNDPPGFIVINQEVGNLPPFKAEAFCERVMDKFCNSKEWIEFKKKYPNWNFILLPTRECESHVEIFHQDDKQREDMQSVVVECLSDDASVLEDTPELRRRAIEYVLLMFGAPVINLEFTQSQLDFCYSHSLNTLRDAFQRKKTFTLLDSARAQDENFLFEGVLAHATVILGRIRMHTSVPQDGRTHMDPKDLYEDGKSRLAKWKRWLDPEIFNEGA